MANPFLKLKAALGDLAAMVREREAAREKLLQRIDELNGLPLPKEDALEMLNRTVDMGKQDYIDRLSRLINESFHKNGMTPRAGNAQLLAPHSAGGINSILPVAIYGLFQNQLTESLARIIQDMEWPEAGPPLAERKAELEKLNRDLGKVESELEELKNSAKSAGVMLQ
ncbi:MAG: hypothetical protein M8357_00550 [Desulfobulbaceae bacterium]|nr:hypothetical protein [Desulfobulbaceae bacterium]